MRKIILLLIISIVVSACTVREPTVADAGSAYSIAGSEISLDGDLLTVRNTYNEESARLQLDVTYYRGSEELGRFITVGRGLTAGDYHAYKLDIPEGTEAVKVSYAEYKNKGGGIIIGTPQVTRGGAVVFILTK